MFCERTLIWGNFFLLDASHSLIIFPQSVHRSSSDVVSPTGGLFSPEEAELTPEVAPFKIPANIPLGETPATVPDPGTVTSWKEHPEVMEIWEVSEERREWPDWREFRDLASVSISLKG